MNFKEFLKNNIVYLDGGMGTLLQAKGLVPGEKPELWNISKPNVITEVHRRYFDAGSNVVCTNTFGANALKFSESELELIVRRAIINAKLARDQSCSNQAKFIALDIGPSGRLLKPLGDLDFDEAVELFAKTIRLGVKYGIDLILIETMNDCYETKAALLAAKENSDLPVIVTNAYGEDGKLMTGASPTAMLAMLEGMGADAIGANCSLGPAQLEKVVLELLENASVPVVLKPNAGIPRIINGETVFDVSPEEFSLQVSALIKKGVRVVGGCCGTSPEYIHLLHKASEAIAPVPVVKKELSLVSSYTHAVCFNSSPILIGERINPTGKKRFKQALLESDMNYILSEAVSQQEKGVHILDVNVGLPDIDEVSVLKTAMEEIQAVSNLPLQLDSSNPAALEAALRRYNGKAMINSVNGKKDSMDAIFPLAKKYGGMLVALTLDDNGIPDTAAGRLEIARNILKTAEAFGISKKDIIFDPLAMTVSADKNSANVTLESLKLISEELGCSTSLGVSNISFGLPNRDAINSAFFSMALERGLSAAIMNPYSEDMMKTYYCFNALKGYDDNCAQYISFTQGLTANDAKNSNTVLDSELTLQKAVIKGFKDSAADLTKKLLSEKDALSIVNEEIIPALDTVGLGYENKTVYLPQLLMSAEAAKSAFEVIKCSMNSAKGSGKKLKIVIATVHGDIHDIGKNIVKLLLENYGFDVIDLGKDVPPELIVEAVVYNNASLAGLSALMTTTVPAMEETIRQLRAKAPDCKIIVGGAVLTKEYAEKIGADKYAKDAMETVRYSEEIEKVQS